MSFPSSDRSQDTSYIPSARIKTARGHQSPWGSSTQQTTAASSSVPTRKGLAPLSTAAASAAQLPSSASPSPARNTFNITTTSSSANHAQPSTNPISSRHSSVSSSSSILSPGAPASQQAYKNRFKTTTSPHLGSSGSSFSPLDRNPAGSSGASRYSRQNSTATLLSAGPGSAPTGQLTSLVLTQLNILLSTLKEDKDKSKWESQVDKILKLIDEHGMEVFSQFFRRLLHTNAAHVFSTSVSSPDSSAGTYQLLVNELQKLTTDELQAQKIAAALDTSDGDIFKDFDLNAFVRHFKLHPIAVAALTIACKDASKSDLKAKADALLSDQIDDLIAALSEPSEVDDMDTLSPEFIASLIDRLIHSPPQDWNEDRQAGLQYAVKYRYTRQQRVVPYSVGAVMYLIDQLATPNPLLRLLRREGCQATQSLEACRSLLAETDSSAITTRNVACALLYTAITSAKGTYDPSVLVGAIRQHRFGKNLNWQDVVSAFDTPNLRVTKSQFLTLYNALLPLALEKEGDEFDIQALWGTTASQQQTNGIWSNPQTQLSFVVAFLSASPEELDVSQIPRLRTAFSVAEFAPCSAEIQEYASKAVMHPMVSRDATNALFTIIFSSQEAYNSAQKLGIPEAVINANTDIFVCAASAVEKPWASLQEQALKQLFNPFFSKALPNHGFVMHALWVHDKMWLAGRLIEHYNANQTLLSLVFEHAQEHDWIEALNGVRNDFGLDFTALAHSHSLVVMDRWASDHIQNSTVPAAELSRAIINFLRFKIEDELLVQREHLSPSTTPLKVCSVYAFLNVIQGTVTEQEEGAIQRQCIQAYPRLINYGYKFDAIIDANGNNGNALSEEADAKMQEQYKNMYGGDADARKMISTLRELKESEVPADQEHFASMIGGLFDEYNCFGEYPLEALATTAVLFGGIINYGILHSRITLSVALYMVVDAVAEFSPEDSMYKFGLQALLHFMKRLEEWPQLCERLCRIPGLRGTDVLTQAEEVIRGHAGQEANVENSDPLAPAEAGADQGTDEPAYQPFVSIHADALSTDHGYETPNEDVSDKVMFVLNNVSMHNLDDKFKELKSVLEDRHFQWVAQYLVGDLVKMQPNFQALYLHVLDRFNSKALRVEVLRETYECMQRILNAEATMGSTTDRTYLKNLAGWLGLITLARNLPILHRNISFKDLLIEAHQTQRLLIAIPFTCKVLAQAAQSTTFKPPNPWTMEVIGLLIELYHFAELKLNLKFEIEVLCKELDLDHKTLEPLEIIRAIPSTAEETFLQHYPAESVDGFSDMLGLSKRANERISAAEIMESLPDLSTILVLPPAPGNVSQQSLKTVFLTAARQAIQEIIGPVVDRSVTIAAISTFQLVEKDFATEPDIDKMQHSAYTMVKALSGSLALVTCKEPLRMAMSNNVRLLASEHLPDQLPEGSILMFMNDNLDVVCKLVENTAESYSMAEIDVHLENSVESRRRYMQQRSNQPFNEPPVSRWAFAIPEPYRQNHKGLNNQQMLIYEEFGRHARVPPVHASSNTQDSNTRQLPDVLSDNYLPNFQSYSDGSHLQRIQQPPRMQTPPSLGAQQGTRHINGFADAPNIMERVHKLLSELQRVAREAPEAHIRDLGPTAPTREVYEQLVRLIDASVQKDNLAVAAGQHATLLVYSDAKTRLEVEVLVQFLNQLCAISVPTARQLVMYLATIEDDRIFNTTVTVCLLKTLLIDIHHIDFHVAKAIAQRRSIALDFLGSLVDELLLSEHTGALRADVVLGLGELSQWARDEPDNEPVRQVLDKFSQPLADVQSMTTEPQNDKHDQMEYVLEEWIQLQRSDTPERALVAFINQLHSSQLITDHDDFALLLRVCIDVSVDAYEREEALPFGSLDHAYIHVDAVAKLAVFLVSYQGASEGAVEGNKVKYLEHILCFIVLVLNHHYHTRSDRFNSKVFYRLFSSLMIELNGAKAHFADVQTDAWIVVGESLLTLQPQLFPGFSFAWLSLISHRTFLTSIMRSTDEKGWDILVKLLSSLLTHLDDLMQASAQTTIVQDYYRASLRVLCMMQHDFPTFVAKNCLALNSSIPFTMVQLHNVINCANPASFEESPDPFTPGLKINRLEQIRQPPQIAGDVVDVLSKAGIKDAVDQHLSSKNVQSEYQKRLLIQ